MRKKDCRALTGLKESMTNITFVDVQGVEYQELLYL